MEQDTIRARSIKLVDDEGTLTAVLDGGEREEGERSFAGLILYGPDGGEAAATIAMHRDSGSPSIRLYTAGGGDIIAFFDDEGRAVLHLKNEDGAEQTFTPQTIPRADSNFGYVPAQDILPIFTADLTGEDAVFHSHQGTGFLVGKNVIVTCWHCVEAELPEEHAYVAIRKDDNGDNVGLVLVSIEQDRNGADLATARIDAEPEMGLRIAEEPALMSEDIWSFGYPLTDVTEQSELGRKRFRPNPRWMQSYILRDFDFAQPGFGDTPSYELDMPALEGMSGAPIVKAGSREVIGVLYGRNDAEQMEEFGTRDPATKERLTPDVVRMTYFALAHYTDTLRNLSGAATQGRPLADFLKS